MSSNLDGDFVALEKIKQLRRETRDASRTKKRSASDILTLMEEDGEDAGETGSISPGLHPDILIPQERFRQMREELFTAAKQDDHVGVQKLMTEFESNRKSVADDELLDEENKSNVFHHAVIANSTSVARYVIDRGDSNVLLATFDVRVGKIESKKTALHVLSETGNLELIKAMLDKIPAGKNKDEYIHQTVLMEVAGQRPRQLPSIQIAALNGHTPVIDYLVQIGVDVNTTNVKHDTPVLWAARGNHIQTVRRLIQLGADLQHQNDKGSTPLYWACRYGFGEMARVLMTEGKADVHQQRKLGLISPIVLTSALGYTEIVRDLLKHGADVNLRIQNKYTPLHHAAANGNNDTVQLLLESKANIHAQTEYGDTPLLLAAQAGEPETLELLCRHGANVDERNTDGRTMWHAAVEAEDEELLATVIVCYRRAKRLPPHRLVLPVGKSALHLAAMTGDVRKVEFLLHQGAEAGALDEGGNTFFHLAARENKTDILTQFMGKVDLAGQNSDGDTALHLAARSGHLESVTSLLKKVKLDLVNTSKETVLHVVCKNALSTPELVQLIVDTIVKTHSWSLVDATDRTGNTALHVAAKTGRADLIAALRPLNPRIANVHLESPVHVAAKTGRVDVLEALIQTFPKGLNLNQQDSEGRSALHIAAQCGNHIMVALLIDSGIDLTIQDTNGNTTLHMLVIQGTLDDEYLPISIQVIQTIIDSAVRWWCRRGDLHCPDEESDAYDNYRRRALTYLTSEITNNQDMSVLLLASKLAAKSILELFLHTRDVYMFVENNTILFDITNVIPETVGKDHNGNRSQVSPFRSDSNEVLVAKSTDDLKSDAVDVSCLDLIVTSDNIAKANVMLDVIPINQIVRDIWSAYQWIYGLLMLIHIVYMSCLSAYTIPLVSTLNITAPAQSAEPEVFPNVLFITWPAILILFEVYYTIHKIHVMCTNRATDPNTRLSCRRFFMAIIDWFVYYLVHIAGFFFAALVIVWFALYAFKSVYQVHTICVALVVGWLYTIAFTDGFETVHSFSIMLKNIIIRDITRFFALYIFVLLGFSFGMQALMYASSELKQDFPTSWHVMFLVFNLMIGMGEFDDAEATFSQLGWPSLSVYLKVVYLIYIILTTIILLNLLIAMMSDSYASVKAREGTTWRLGSVRLAMQLEKSMPILPKFFKAMGIKKTPIYRDYDTGRWMMRMPIDTTQLAQNVEQDKAMRILKRLENEVALMRSNFSDVYETLSQISEKVEGQIRPGTPGHSGMFIQKLRRRKTSNLGALIGQGGLGLK